jgi:hypothetical protein
MEVFQEVLPVAGEPVLLKVGEGEREGVVDADECGDVPVEFLAEPLGETLPSPVPPWTGWRLNLYRRAGALGHEHPEPLATGFGRHSAGVVDADVAVELGHSNYISTSRPSFEQTIEPQQTLRYEHGLRVRGSSFTCPLFRAIVVNHGKTVFAE